MQRLDGLFFHFRGNIVELLLKRLQIISDFELLRTLLFAFSAFDTVLGFVLILKHKGPPEINIPLIGVHPILVPQGEILRDVDAGRARHAVAATGAAIFDALPDFFRDTAHDLVLRIG